MISAIINNYIQSAKKNNRQFSLTREEFIDLIKQKCYYCGIAFSNKKKSKNLHEPDFTYNGIDRVDNNKGYEIKNCVPCCTLCNFMKKDINQKEFLNWIEKSYKWINKIK